MLDPFPAPSDVPQTSIKVCNILIQQGVDPVVHPATSTRICLQPRPISTSISTHSWVAHSVDCLLKCAWHGGTPLL